MPLAPALAPLASLKQFVLCRIDPAPELGAPWKTNKIPLDPRRLYAGDAQDPANWIDAETAYNTARLLGPRFGVGFVLTASDPLFCIDIDGCLQPDNTWSPVAKQLMQAFPGAAIELSDSGRGLHIWGCGTAPAHGKKNVQWGLEFYTELRFILLGRHAHATGDVRTDHSAMLAHLVPAYFPPGASGTNTPGASADEWTDTPCEGWKGPTDDADLIRRALRSQSAASIGFGGSQRTATFAQLYECDVEALTRAYPPSPNSSDVFDRSSADMALATALAFWTGKDMVRIERLMRGSALMRPKWDERGDYYMQRTVRRACAGKHSVCCDTVPADVEGPQAPESSPTGSAFNGSTLIFADRQLEMFKGCILIEDAHKVLLPGGTLMTPSQFRTRFGGYSFVMDSTNTRTPTRDAWEALTESQIQRCPRVKGTIFRPDLEFGTIINDGGDLWANSYWPIATPRAPGDVSPFLDHLRRVLPDQRDQQLLLSYMAACVQHKGTKFGWAPVLQGVEGNGKTLFSTCVAEAIGSRYVHWPKASKIAGNFNAWMDGKLFYAVEDIHVGEGQADIIEQLKPMITGGTGLEIEAKRVDQVSRNIVGNFMFNSNHKSGMRKTRNDRRFAVFYTAQQDVDHLARDGMSEDYFTRLYGWLKSGGYAIVHELLATWPIPDEMNPAKGCTRAPRTSTTDEALSLGVGRIEQEILESVAQGEQGFAGGWISDNYLKLLIDRMGKSNAISPQRRREMVLSLGYEPHPHLVGGRVDNRVLPDNCKPLLYIRKEHRDRVLGRGEAARAYTAAQTAATTQATATGVTT